MYPGCKMTTSSFEKRMAIKVHMPSGAISIIPDFLENLKGVTK
jgi:hypothetical protein